MLREWKNGRPHGQGTGTLPDGRKYVGEYKDGKRNGQGTLTFPDGSTFSDGKNMKGSGRMETLGTEYYTTKRETSYTRL